MTTAPTQANTMLRLPSLGESASEATITRWLKKPGDVFVTDEPLLEVATDKVDTEVPAPFAGTLIAVVAEEDELVEVGAELAEIRRNVEAPAAEIPDRNASAIEPPQEAADSGANNSAPRYDVADQVAAPVIEEHPENRALSAGQRREKLTRMRRVIADRMMESLHTTAQLTSVVEVDVTPIATRRARYKAQGRKISYLPFFIRATIEALKAYPVFNTTTTPDGTELIYHDAINMGIAVDSPKGLLVPVIHNVQDEAVDTISTAVEELAERVRSGNFTRDDLDGGTITITNTGSRGALFDTPILNHPQTAILGTGTVVERVVPLSKEELRIGVRSFAYLSLTYDHRMVDGADAARFLSHIKNTIESGNFGQDS